MSLRIVEDVKTTVRAVAGELSERPRHHSTRPSGFRVRSFSAMSLRWAGSPWKTLSDSAVPKYLAISSGSFSKPVDHLPPNLTFLQLSCKRYPQNCVFCSLPRSLKTLILAFNSEITYPDALRDLPPITKLLFNFKMDDFSILPHSITHLKSSYDNWSQQIIPKTLPNSLTQTLLTHTKKQPRRRDGGGRVHVRRAGRVVRRHDLGSFLGRVECRSAVRGGCS